MRKACFLTRKGEVLSRGITLLQTSFALGKKRNVYFSSENLN